MSRLRNQDVHQIVQLFENELSMLPKVSRTDKMKLRKKISNTLIPLLNHPSITAQTILHRVDARLEDVISLFFDANRFRIKLTSLLTERLQ